MNTAIAHINGLHMHLSDQALCVLISLVVAAWVGIIASKLSK